MGFFYMLNLSLFTQIHFLLSTARKIDRLSVINKQDAFPVDFISGPNALFTL
jgi:hypothetical protein